MTLDEYVQFQQKLGKRIHSSDGVWWERVHPFYCRPAYQFQTFRPKTAKPRFSRSALGYSHQVPTPEDGNRTMEWMILEGDDLAHFSLDRLKSEKRTRIRKGLKHCDIQLILDIEPHLENARQINITQASRLMAKGNFPGLPATAYTERAKLWRDEFRRVFRESGCDWWGAFAEEQLVAYMLTQQVVGDLWVHTVKSHTAFMGLCPSDALHYTVLESASRGGTCQRVIHGGRGAESLVRFKELYGFRVKAVPYFTARKGLWEMGRATSQVLRSLRTGVRN